MGMIAGRTTMMRHILAWLAVLLCGGMAPVHAASMEAGKAAFEQARAYETGKGVARDAVKAAEWRCSATWQGPKT